MQVTGVTAVMSNLNHFFCDRRTSTGASGRGGASQRVRSTQRSGAGCLGSFSCRSIGLYHVCLCLENPGTIFLLKTKFLDNYHHFLPRNYIFTSYSDVMVQPPQKSSNKVPGSCCSEDQVAQRALLKLLSPDWGYDCQRPEMAPGAVNFPPLASYGLGAESIKPKVSATEFQKWF